MREISRDCRLVVDSGESVLELLALAIEPRFGCLARRKTGFTPLPARLAGARRK
jgi:hypothetical protein